MPKYYFILNIIWDRTELELARIAKARGMAGVILMFEAFDAA